MNSNNNQRDKLGIRIEGVQAILSVRDMQASRAFYIDVLGFEEAEWGTDDFTSSIANMQAFIYARERREIREHGFGLGLTVTFISCTST
jgi:catechol 2,3-dioxygenase-like lactoylglutathione lyase family enzyme